MTNETEHLAHVAQAKYLGADAALAAASWLTMSEDDARSILDDVDPEVMDRYPQPSLSGEFVDDPTPRTLAVEVDAPTVDDIPASFAAETLAAITDAWEAGRDEVWSDALQGVALRLLGDVIRALDVEQRLERHVDALRVAR